MLRNRRVERLTTDTDGIAFYPRVRLSHTILYMNTYVHPFTCISLYITYTYLMHREIHNITQPNVYVYASSLQRALHWVQLGKKKETGFNSLFYDFSIRDAACARGLFQVSSSSSSLHPLALFYNPTSLMLA